ncbi:hypothetical protein IVG45_06650 [Methylomonas sp. LL1]|uniref:hypothetical protein n=1 Tax=Methylomonas sp. LL1 TaxID=2785785 RepID=UPI0018C37067|nr:hypothetical protein [Methylomonas sp. LL1]QPK64629.1 hypothetical protein IVG45_06650 [Methylomonas sp. LL1]
MNDSRLKIRSAGLGYFINRIQTLFVSMLRIWTIPIVLMLSVSSGFTTYYGLSHFITPWIALVITIAIQSIIVICSLEMAGIHWTANRTRYFSVVASLFIALAASVTFSYFKFYEISEQETLHINRVQQIRQDIKTYLDTVLVQKGQLLQKHKQELDQASLDASQAYFGTHDQIGPGYKNQVGEGPFWRHYNQVYQEKKQAFQGQEQAFLELDSKIRSLQTSLSDLDVAENPEPAYQQLLKNYQDIQLIVNQLSSSAGLLLPDAPMLMTYKQFIEEVKPSFAMWQGFSWFAFACAAMVDFFTVLLSYRLEFTAPGPLTAQEEELVFECLRQFSEFRINENDELEMIIEKSELEKARRYSDWTRMFVVGLLLSRGFLRKVDARTVEFAPNLYPLIAEKMSDKIAALKAKALVNPSGDQS